MKKIVYFFCFILIMGFGCFAFSSEWQLFFKEFIQHPGQVGSIIPSSEYTCHELTHYVRNRVVNSEPYRILEVGAGTGVVTRHILQSLCPGDVYDIVEADAAMVEKLRTLVATAQYSAKQTSTVRVYHGGFEHFFDQYGKEKHSYTVVITTLPFNAFPLSLVQQCLSAIRDALAPTGHWSYIEYRWLANIKITFVPGSRSESLRLIKKELRDFCATAQEKCSVFVLRNIPPTYVYHLTFKN